jgi:hypothetical protein
MPISYRFQITSKNSLKAQMMTLINFLLHLIHMPMNRFLCLKRDLNVLGFNFSSLHHCISLDIIQLTLFVLMLIFHSLIEFI